ncbi:single-stranded DNA-binding protein [Peptostreptococcus stomatis]
MQREMININVNLISDIRLTEIDTKDGKIKVANFSVLKKSKKDKTKEYINCNLYGDKVDEIKDFNQGDFIHIFGYYKQLTKGEKTYKNFVVKHINKIEKDNEDQEEK